MIADKHTPKFTRCNKPQGSIASIPPLGTNTKWSPHIKLKRDLDGHIWWQYGSALGPTKVQTHNTLKYWHQHTSNPYCLRNQEMLNLHCSNTHPISRHTPLPMQTSAIQLRWVHTFQQCRWIHCWGKSTTERQVEKSQSWWNLQRCHGWWRHRQSCKLSTWEVHAKDTFKWNLPRWHWQTTLKFHCRATSVRAQDWWSVPPTTQGDEILTH